MINKEKLLFILKHLKGRYNLTAEKWAFLLGVPLDTYKNAIYKNVLSADNMLLIIQKLDVLIQAHIVELDKEELEVLA